jgi:hypothetical protein
MGVAHTRLSSSFELSTKANDFQPLIADLPAPIDDGWIKASAVVSFEEFPALYPHAFASECPTLRM